MNRREKPRIVVTGLGAITPVGLNVEESWQALVAGRSGLGPFTQFDASAFPCQVVGEVKGFDPKSYLDAKEARRMARFSQFGVVATREALVHAGLDLSREDTTRIGVLIGNGNGGYPDLQQACQVLFSKGGMRINPFFMPMSLPNMAASQISLTFGLRGYSSTVTTACAASTQAIGEAAEVIRRGWADVMVAGGTEAGISELGLSAFCVMRALSTGSNAEPAKASRPFDAKRDGFVPAEGAGILILERLDHALARGAPILAELAGYGASADAHHLVAPEPDGDGAARAILGALADADLTPADIDYVNAHGTSTPLNDASETVAIKRALGKRAYGVAISSTKSMIGHALGGAGGIEAVAAVQTIRTGTIHPTINYEVPDPECDLDYVPNVPRQANVRVVLSNSFGFGGQNACLILTRFE